MDFFTLDNNAIETKTFVDNALVYLLEITNELTKVTVFCNEEDKGNITEAKIRQFIEIDEKEYAVDYIGISAFKDCINLRKVELPEGIEKIFAGAFAETVLEEIRLPNSLKHLGFGAFSGCEKLKKVSIPTDCEINGNPFAGCNMDELKIENRNT